jgi:hypothetical protein
MCILAQLMVCHSFSCTHPKDPKNVINLELNYCVATLAFGSRPRQGVARLRAKRKEAREWRQRHYKVASQKEGNPGAKTKALEGCGPRVSPGVITYSREFKEVWGSVRGWTLTLPRQLPLWERESRWTPKTSEANGRVKYQWIVALLIPLESSWNVDV